MLVAVAKAAAAPEAAAETSDKIEQDWAAVPAVTTSWNNNKTAFISGGMI